MNEFKILLLLIYCLGVRDALGDVEFETERQLNSYITRQPPHCSLCSIFSTKPVSCSTYSYWNAPPSFSSQLRPNILFLISFSQEENIISLSWKQDIVQGSVVPDETSAIFYSKFWNIALQNATVLRCHGCLLRVHNKCYQATLNEPLPWMCDKCREDKSIPKVYAHRIR